MIKKCLVWLLAVVGVLDCFGQETIESALKNFPALTTTNPTPIMILGTFHFNFNENVSDVKGQNNFDITTEQRQKELKALIDKIRRFKPTKIAVEHMESNQNKLDSLYQAYSKGSWKLEKNETYQIGFRLARELGLKGVSAVDIRPPQVELDTTIDNWEEYAGQRNELEKWQAYNEPNDKVNNYIESLRAKMTILDYLLFLNSKKVKHRYKQFFLTGLVQVGAGDTYVGADLTGYWYRRNTRIFTNISRIVKKEGERVLVIYGNSHAWILEELFSASPEFRVVPVEAIVK